MRRVAITGMGVVSAMGVGLGAFWDGLMASRSGSRRVSLSDPGRPQHSNRRGSS